MMQKVQKTAAGLIPGRERQRLLDRVETCWKQTTVGRYFYTGLIGSMRMCGG